MFKRRAWERKTIKRKSSKVAKDRTRPQPINLLQQVKDELGLVKVESARYNRHTAQLIRAFQITIDKNSLTKEGI